ncbi:initiator RepB protein [Enterococcus faecium TX0133a04]|nr:initiator RepB protein [Enterococcus faecium TX0133a01]EFR70853.1 initiator RepB protein [Enterococcus faecium TX0133B]EFR75157.1 initiator RepB protein [Enterococcus faecium TX0133A]EFR77821.1 initiator RepB protein [Enterococcus faecium TX0133C]EFS05884.1 initiator RepB protein [Enterococcus faecium TX0133a04]EJX45793.1 initiator RepB protein [Enterococcus faecium R501]
MREKGDKTVRLTFDQLKDLSNYKATANNRFINDLEMTYDKLMDLRFGKRSANGLDIDRFVMFSEFKIRGTAKDPYVDIQVYEKALPLLNNLDEWVRYSLQQFNELQSSYAKTMFRLLKQYRTKGFAYFSKEDFHELLDIPKSYWNNQANVDNRVIKPIRQELTAIFKGLSIKKKYGKGRGKPVVGYQFTFKPEIKKADDFNKHAPTKEEQNKALALADKQKEYEEPATTINEKIKQKKRELELLQQIKQLEKEKEALEKQTESALSKKEKKSLLSDLDNLFQ